MTTSIEEVHIASLPHSTYGEIVAVAIPTSVLRVAGDYSVFSMPAQSARDLSEQLRQQAQGIIDKQQGPEGSAA